MKRNQKEEKWKYLERLEKKKDSLARSQSPRYSREDDMVWVPVDEPQFIGWETTVVLGETGSRRRDAHLLNQVLSICKFDQPVFSRTNWLIKLIRSTGRRYMLFRERYFERMKKKNQFWNNYTMRDVRDYREMKLDTKMIEELHPSIKKYFVKISTNWPASAWRDAYTTHYYRLSELFPFYELTIKAVKAYSTHRGIPKSDEISERTKIEARLEGEAFYSKKYGRYSHDAWNNRRENRALRKRWSAICNVAVKYKKKHISSVVDGLQGKYVRIKQ